MSSSSAPKKRVAACAGCNRLKIKCVRASTTDVCRRCDAVREECVTPARHFGRTWGSKNKKTLLRLANDLDASAASTSGQHYPVEIEHGTIESSAQPYQSFPTQQAQWPLPNNAESYIRAPGPSRISQYPHVGGTGLQDSLEPLQMLNITVPQSSSRNDCVNYASILESFDGCARQLDPIYGVELVREGLEALFAPNLDDQSILKEVDRADLPLSDAGISEYDPLSLGLVTWREAEHLFRTFFAEVQPSLRILDPSLHSITFVRSRSSFLFSVMLEVSQTSVSDGTQEKRETLRKHTDWLISEIHGKGFKSIEICQAFQIRSAWQMPSSLSEQRIWQQLGSALTMAIELRLEVEHPYCVSCDSDWKQLDKIQQERRLRNAQRAWLCLFNRDRAIASICGRSAVLPEGPLLAPDFLRRWFRSPFAILDDVTTVAAVDLRRMIPSTQTMVTAQHGRDPLNFEAIKAIVDSAIAKWRQDWHSQMDDSAFAYFNLTATFTRFFLIATPYDMAMRTKTLPEEARDQCLLAALEACQAAVQHLSARKRQYEAAGRKQFAPTLRFALIMYAASASIKLLESCEGASAGMGPAADLYHLAILAQLAKQIQAIGSPNARYASAAYTFGVRLMALARRLAAEKISSFAIEAASSEGNESEADTGLAQSSFYDYFVNDNYLSDVLVDSLWCGAESPTHFKFNT